MRAAGGAGGYLTTSQIPRAPACPALRERVLLRFVAWKIIVDYDECEANAVCVGIDPEVFEVDDEDNLWVHQEYPGPDHIDRAKEAVASCPKRALALREVPDSEAEAAGAST